MIADLALAEQFPCHLAELNKQNPEIPYQFQPCDFHMKKRLSDKRRFLTVMDCHSFPLAGNLPE